MDRIRAFFAAAPAAVRGHLNVAEIRRVGLTALLAGATGWGVLEAVLTSATIHADPELGSAFVALVVAAIEVYRRLGHQD